MVKLKYKRIILNVSSMVYVDMVFEGYFNDEKHLLSIHPDAIILNH